MTTNEIENLLFAAYDIRNTLSTKQKNKPIDEASFGETVGSNLDAIINGLEQLADGE
jgi:hypothetical protein